MSRAKWNTIVLRTRALIVTIHSHYPSQARPSYMPTLEPYLQHLSAIHQARGVFAAEDIHTAEGVVLLKAGQGLPARLDEWLRRHTLRKPLQSSVEVDASLSAARIRDDIIKSIPPQQMLTVYGRYDLITELERGIALFLRYPLLTQQLTVLALQLPSIYQQTLVVTWVGLVLGIKLKMGRTERSELVVGALGHMLGMLHVRPEVTNRTDRLSDEEQTEVQLYVQRGKTTLESIPGLSAAIIAMVAEHRELPDGTGYPRQLEANDLGLSGQIIGVAQSAYSIYTKGLRPRGRTPRDLIPIIQINSAVYRRDVCSALLQLLREQNLPEISRINDENVTEVVLRLLEDAAAIEACKSVVSDVIGRLRMGCEQPSVARAEKIYRHLESILSSSGLLDPGHIIWMNQVGALKYRQFYREIEDLDLMLGEVRWQIGRVGKILRELPAEGDLLSGEESALDRALKKIRLRY